MLLEKGVFKGLCWIRGIIRRFAEEAIEIAQEIVPSGEMRVVDRDETLKNSIFLGQKEKSMKLLF